MDKCLFLWYFLFVDQNKNRSPAAELPTSLLPDQPEIPPHAPVMNDLYDVGPTKPLGYLPILTLARLGEHPDAVTKFSRERGLSTFYLEPPDDPNKLTQDLGELYVYDEAALQHLLQQNTQLLEKHGWPVLPGDFVTRVATDRADQKRQADLFKLIAWAFNDRRPEYARPAPGEPLKVEAMSWLGRIAAAVFRR